MDATFTETQEQLADLAGRIATAPPAASPAGETWQALVDTGLLGLHLDAARGGGGTGAVEVAIVAEALGRAASPVPFAGPVLALELLTAAGAPDEWTSAVAGGHRRLTLALDRTLSGPATLGDGTGIGFDAQDATGFVGFGVGGAGTGVAVVTGPSVPTQSADLTRHLVEIGAAEDAGDAGGDVVPVGGPLGDEALSRWEALAQVVLCADMVGVMRGALDLAVAHARDRHQFGRPIGSFQAIAHLAADQYVSTEAATGITYFAAWAVDELPADRALLAALTAKAYVAPRAREVTEAVLQIHGGMGHTWEHRPHYYLRRALLDRITLGDESAHLPRIAQFGPEPTGS